MKSKLILLIALSINLGGCIKEKDDKIKEVPDEIIRTPATPILYERIVELFPDASKAINAYPSLFSDTVQKRIVLTEESEVYLTFIAENATYKNSVGWYSYALGSEPQSVKDVNIHVLFPNVSGKGEGGELVQGDMLQLGETKFPKGTVIGFFLIIQGWGNGAINYNNPTHYTDLLLNVDSRQQHVLFKEKASGDIILGFEDMDYAHADKDYNDILFRVSDNKDGYESISFDLTKVPVM